MSTFRQERMSGLIMLSPLLLLVAVLVAYPFGSAIGLSLTDKQIGLPPKFVGLKNFQYLLTDPIFHRTVRNSLLYTVSAVLLKLSLGMMLAIALNRIVRFRTFVRSMVLLPWVIPTAVSAMVWLWMFNDTLGVLNWLLGTLGLTSKNIGWLGSPSMAMGAIIAVNVWRGTPFFGVSLLAGLQSIPREHYEAATVDGASPVQSFWHITIPGLRPAIAITFLLSAIETLADFQLVHILTRGGPGNSTQIFSILTYLLGFQVGRMGRAVSVSLFMLPLVVLLIYTVTRLMRVQEER